MTRETKVGVVVASTFACLLSVVVASKLRRPDQALEPIIEEPQEPQHGAPPGPLAQAPPAKPADPAPPPGVPSIAISGQAPSQAMPMPLRDPLVPAPVTPMPNGPRTEPSNPVQVLPKDPLAVQSAPNQPSFPAPVQIGGVSAPIPPAINATPGGQSGPRPFVGPLPETPPALPPIAQQGEPKKTQMPAVPVSDPLVTPPMPAAAKVTIPDPIAPNPKEPLAQSTPDLLPRQPAPVPAGPQKNPLAELKDPLATPPVKDPLAIQQPAKDPLISPQPAKDPLATPAPAKDPLAVPPPVRDPLATLPAQEPKASAPTLTAPVTVSAPVPAKPAVIGTIGTTGSEVPVTPVLNTPGGAPVSSPGRELPKVISHSDDVRYTTVNDTSFAQLSKQHYGNEKYGQALLEYNRRHLLGRTNANLQQNPPVLRPDQAIYYPHANVLESQYGQYIQSAPAAVARGTATPPVVQISPPMPLTGTGNAGNVGSANPPTADPTRPYTVPQTQHIFAIAQQTLGSGNLWTEILRLNPTLRTDQPIPAGTELRLPLSARAN
jgi:hypothetical protein